MLKPIRNSIQCKKCGDFVSSLSTHDFKYCSCKSVAIDGGFEYARVIGNPEDYINFSIFENKEGLIGTIAEDNKFVPLKEIRVPEEKLEQLFLDFLNKYDSEYDPKDELVFSELQYKLIEKGSKTAGKIIIPVKTLNQLFQDTFESDVEYQHHSEIFHAFKNQIITLNEMVK